MLPMSDFPLTFCGIAAVAATLGYACARRAVLSLASAPEPSKADVEAGTSEERSLKRKLDDSDEHDTDAEEQSRPMKRNRTPPADYPESDEDFYQEWQVVVAPPPYEQATGHRQPEEPVQDKSTPSQEDIHAIEQHVTPIRAPTPLAHLENSPQAETTRCATPQLNQSPNEPEMPPPPRPVTPPRPKSVNAFSAFSGSSSPFASYSNASGASPFALSGQTVKTAPAWRRNNESEPDVSGRARSANVLAPSPNVTSATALSQTKTVGPKETQSLAKSSACLTGEEDETVEAELKGIKLFIKRGRKEFTDGIYGHIKVLTQRSTPPKIGNKDSLGTEDEVTSRTRLLFRRDPLGQVSMNVGLNPTVTTTNEKDSKDGVVIYALKPGRAQKADFQSFAKTLCDHEGLKSSVLTSPTTLTSGAAAASR